MDMPTIEPDYGYVLTVQDSDITNCEELMDTDELSVVRTYLSLERRNMMDVGAGGRRFQRENDRPPIAK